MGGCKRMQYHVWAKGIPIDNLYPTDRHTTPQRAVLAGATRAPRRSFKTRSLPS